eukprot:9746609-Lingulodinium_polyedra.AAC.1
MVPASAAARRGNRRACRRSSWLPSGRRSSGRGPSSTRAGRNRLFFGWGEGFCLAAGAGPGRPPAGRLAAV